MKPTHRMAHRVPAILYKLRAFFLSPGKSTQVRPSKSTNAVKSRECSFHLQSTLLLDEQMKAYWNLCPHMRGPNNEIVISRVYFSNLRLLMQQQSPDKQVSNLENLHTLEDLNYINFAAFCQYLQAFCAQWCLSDGQSQSESILRTIFTKIALYEVAFSNGDSILLHPSDKEDATLQSQLRRSIPITCIAQFPFCVPYLDEVASVVAKEYATIGELAQADTAHLAQLLREIERPGSLIFYCYGELLEQLICRLESLDLRSNEAWTGNCLSQFQLVDPERIDEWRKQYIQRQELSSEKKYLIKDITTELIKFKVQNIASFGQSRACREYHRLYCLFFSWNAEQIIALAKRDHESITQRLERGHNTLGVKASQNLQAQYFQVYQEQLNEAGRNIIRGAKKWLQAAKDKQSLYTTFVIRSHFRLNFEAIASDKEQLRNQNQVKNAIPSTHRHLKQRDRNFGRKHELRSPLRTKQVVINKLALKPRRVSFR